MEILIFVFVSHVKTSRMVDIKETYLKLEGKI